MPDFLVQRRNMVERYRRQGYINTQTMADAALKVPREEFMDLNYVEYAYTDQPFPIPGDGGQTISAPYMYPIFYEPLKLKKNDKVLEIGAGSGYGAALARELVGRNGIVVTIEINETTYKFAKSNLDRTGYDDVKVILGDGSVGYSDEAPYDAICVTAAGPSIPEPLIRQLKAPGMLMIPIGSSNSIFGQDLVLFEKFADDSSRQRVLMKGAYVPLRGKHGWTKKL